MHISDRFSVAQVATLTGLTKSQIQGFDRNEVLSPSLRGMPGPARHGLYTMADVINLRAMKWLMDEFGTKPKEIRRAAHWLATRNPGVEISSLSFKCVGDAIFFRDGESELKIAINPPGQTVLEITLDQIEQEVADNLLLLDDYRPGSSARSSELSLMPDGWVNKLILGDNLDVLRAGPQSEWYIPSESVDLIYLDPPFNSKATYNQLFKEHSGETSAAQIKAFEDTWHWSLEAEQTYRDTVLAGGRLAELLQALRSFLGTSDMMAYVTMMAPRLAEMHRVLKPTGSIYLHCDPTSSHYLKLVMDAIWGPTNYRSEIIWKRTTAHSDARIRFGNVTDTILFYGKSPTAPFSTQYRPYSDEYIASKYRHQDDDGRRYRLSDLNAPGGRGPIYEFQGISRPWRFTKENMLRLEAEGRIYTRSRVPQLKRYLDEMAGMPVGNLWDDIRPINAQAAERLGYPTQKPEALLERILEASSNEGDVVLDPFCGCGTSVAVAERLNRRWIGIDVSDLALFVMDKRLRDTFGEDLRTYQVIGDPTDAASARRLAQRDPYKFQWWVMRTLGADPREKKGADRGIDGVIHFFASSSSRVDRCIVQVKGGRVSSRDVRDLRGVIEREQAAIGVLVTTQPPTREMEREVATAGFFSVDGVAMGDYPRLQILTVDDLFAGYGIAYPRYGHIDGVKEAPRHRKSAGEQRRLAG